METKTIGKFIAALRKASGMTQKDLAERLNVSDKTVSRWERDEGSPDLASIPVLAEIFGVTCDELLRGERRLSDAQTAPEPEISPKAEKQRQRLIKTSLSRYRNRTCIAMGISVCGMIAALICNLAFLRAVLGFLLGSVFFLAAVICQAVFLNSAFLCVEDADLEPQALSSYRRQVIALAQRSVGLTVLFIGFAFPLVMADAFVGLSADNMLLFGLPGAAAFLLIYAVILYFLNASLLCRGIIVLNEKEAAVYHRNHRLKRIFSAVLVVSLAVTGLIHLSSTTIWGPGSIMEGTTFYDYENFIAYMEQDIPYEPYSSGTDAPVELVSPPTYYDQYGNVITEEQAFTRRLEDKNGTVVCQYVARNESVISMRYIPGEGTVLPITVCTRSDLQAARAIASQRHVMFAGIYVAEILTALLIYNRKKAR